MRNVALGNCKSNSRKAVGKPFRDEYIQFRDRIAMR
jgi:hypothetical protein